MKDYIKKQKLYPIIKNRPTKTARGMTATFERSKRNRNNILTLLPFGSRLEPDCDTLRLDVLRLLVHGTTDKLARTRYDIVRTPCPCCGCKQNGKFILAKNKRDNKRSYNENN